MDPAPPRQLRPDVPPALQEVILRCMEPRGPAPPTAAQVAFDLRHPDRVTLTARGHKTRRLGF